MDTNNQTSNNFNANPGLNVPGNESATRDMPNPTTGNNADVKLGGPAVTGAGNAISNNGVNDGTATGTKVDANAGVNAGVTADSSEAVTADNTKPDTGDANRREQLKRRVTERMNELQSSLDKLTGDAANSEHAKGIRTDLQLANDALGGGWEHVGGVEAARLSQWLTTTQYMVGGDRGGNTANGEAVMNPATGDVPNTALPADGAVATKTARQKRNTKKQKKES